jgi:hypothetical protein
MSDHRFTDINDDASDLDPPTQAELDALARILGDDVVWDEPDPSVEDRVIAAIVGEAATARRPAPAPLPAPVPADDRPAPGGPADEGPTGTVVDARHRFRRGGLVLGAAAAVVVVVAIGWAVLRSSEPDTGGSGEQVALAPTDLAPSDASGRADISALPGGTQIVLDVSGLPPAPEGFYYEAWLRKSPEVGVSAGTFHLRGGDAEIVLWSGVSTDDYPLVTVTIQEEGAGAESSGKVVLRGQVKGG